MIEDIKSFMKDIEMLNKKLEAQDKIINTQALEIARLKELQQAKDKLQNDYQEARDKIDELISKIDKAIEKITDDRYSPIERLMLIKAILGEKENV